MIEFLDDLLFKVRNSLRVKKCIEGVGQWI